MKNIKLTIYSHRPRRGSALLLALVLTVILFILGITFVSTTRTDKMASSNAGIDNALDDGVDAVVKQINTVLVQDLFGNGATPVNMLDGTAGNEYWDYPGPDDPWLAPLEPMFLFNNGTEDIYGWRHITDLYGNNFGMPLSPLYFDPDNPDDVDQWDTSLTGPWWWYWVSNIDPTPMPYKPTVARIVSEDDSTITIKDRNDNDETYPAELPWGARADADGDGVADSRWVQIPDITSSKGEPLYTAVRIIDNCGMININTAYRDPTNLTNGNPQWDGTMLSHINLEGIISKTDWDNDLRVTDVQATRYGTVTPISYDDYANDTQYEIDVAQRLLNPALLDDGGGNFFHYEPFDISDELDLRNRFFLTTNWVDITGVITRCGVVWPATFDPHAAPGRMLPLKIGNNLFSSWYLHVTSDLSTGNCNRRHISTTYNFDRVIIPWQDVSDTATIPMPSELRDGPNGWYAWTSWDQSKDKWTYRPICVNDYMRPQGPTLEQIAAAIWLGLPGDPESHENFSPLNWGSDTRLRMACQMAVNLADYVDTDNNVTRLTVNDNDYYGYEPDAPKLYISKLAMSKFDPAPQGGGDVVPHYAIALYNPDTTAVNLGGWKIDVNGTRYELPEIDTPTNPGTIVLIDVDDSVNLQGFVAAEGTAITPLGFSFASTNQIVLLGPDDRPCDIIEVPDISIVIDPDSADEREVWHTTERAVKKYVGYLTNKIFVFDSDPTSSPWSGPLTPGLGTLANPLAMPATPVTAAIQISVKNGDLTNLGEIEDVLVVGASKFNDKYETMAQCWEKFIDDGGNDILAEQLARGRIDLSALGTSNVPFANILKYFTVFNPFSDSVDNDGNGRSDDPANDGEDNDGDGLTDEADETFEKFGEVSELAIAGRININTAPWFVIAQLPWIQDPSIADEDKVKLAQAIVAYRDKRKINDDVDVDYFTDTFGTGESRKAGMGLNVGDPSVREQLGFANIAELLNVTQDITAGQAPDPYYDIRRFGRDAGGLDSPPDFTTDSADNDLEERDVIFHRVSNLVTVRSDVFTAYILVRIGQSGPQRRVIGVFDRSNVFGPGDRPRLVALHPVPDPR